MKKISFMAASLLLAAGASAQDTYLNDQITNNSGEVIGTARYVGMGGAMGALGADMSVIAWNPAGIGLYRRSDASITFGGYWNKSKILEENRGGGTFDQAGVVFNFKTYNDNCPYFNFAFNYQKKLNFNRNFYADNHNMKDLSQLDELAELASCGVISDYNIASAATYYNDNEPYLNFFTQYDLIDPDTKKVVDNYYQNDFRGQYSRYTHHSEGALHGFELNFSTNIKDRCFLGLTVGIDDMNYRSYTNYYEENCSNAGLFGDYSLYDDYKITGYGVNVKLGTIIRPIEDSPFRFGLAVETPTWYRLKSSQVYDFTTYYTQDPSTNAENIQQFKRTNGDESYLEYTIRTPWKLRASVGSTISDWFAWDVDYEWANYSATMMGYPKYDDWDGGSSFASTHDEMMKQHTEQTLKAAHTVRAGVEIRPTEGLSFRLGYNFTSSVYKDNINFDQLSLACGSAAVWKSTNTSYMKMKPTNILTLGVGYAFKHFYADLAYKVRCQKADFYAFDSSFTNSDTYFTNYANPSLANTSLDPTEVDLTRQSIVCTLGVKF